MSWFDGHRRFQERLSAYMDGELPEREAAALEAHVASCGPCSQELEELRALSSLLSDLPAAEPPRSFALSPADVAAPAYPRRPALGRLNTGLRLAGAGFAAALALVVVLDLSGSGGQGDDSQSAIMSFDTSGLGTPLAEEMAAGGVDDSTEQDSRSALEQTTPSPVAAAPAQEAPTTPALPAAGGGTAATGQASGGGVGGSGGVGGPPAADTGAPDADTVTTTPQPTPTPTVTPAPVAAGQATDHLLPNGEQGGAQGPLGLAAGEPDSDDGMSTLLVMEIILAALLGASLLGAAGLTLAQRRRG